MDRIMTTAAAAIFLALLPLGARAALVTRIVPVREIEAPQRQAVLSAVPVPSDPCAVADQTILVLEKAVIDLERADVASPDAQKRFASLSKNLRLVRGMRRRGGVLNCAD